VNLDPADRRRLLLAAVVSLVALPALLIAGREDGSAGPNVATAGVEIDGGGRATDAPVTTLESPADQEDPVYLDGPASDLAPVIAEIAVPASRDSVVLRTATYSSAMWPGGCRAKGVGGGARVTVVNLDNNRTITCIAEFAPADQQADLILHTSQFRQLADLTDAPIPVELRQ
jgi:hypothetical protein